MKFIPIIILSSFLIGCAAQTPTPKDPEYPRDFTSFERDLRSTVDYICTTHDYLAETQPEKSNPEITKWCVRWYEGPYLLKEIRTVVDERNMVKLAVIIMATYEGY